MKIRWVGDRAPGLVFEKDREVSNAMARVGPSVGCSSWPDDVQLDEGGRCDGWSRGHAPTSAKADLPSQPN